MDLLEFNYKKPKFSLENSPVHILISMLKIANSHGLLYVVGPDGVAYEKKAIMAAIKKKAQLKNYS